MMSSLEENLDDARITEIISFGRYDIYPNMRNHLDARRKIILDLLNHGLAMVDDEMDSDHNSIDKLSHFQSLLKKSYLGTIENPSIYVKSADDVMIKLGLELRSLSKASELGIRDRDISKKIYSEVIRYLDTEKINFNRKNKILDQNVLDALSQDIGSSVARQFFYVLYPTGDVEQLDVLSNLYGFAVKSADNLCDFKNDIISGLVNISKDNINYVEGISLNNNELVSFDLKKLSLDSEYVMNEYLRIYDSFQVANDYLLEMRKTHLSKDVNTNAKMFWFGEFCNTWLRQAKEFVKINAQKSDCNNYSFKKN